MSRYFLVLPLAFALASGAVSQVRRQTQKASEAPATKATKAPPRVHYDAAVVNNAATVDLLEKDAEGSAVLRAQILLSRAHFSVGEIDGRMGTNALHAVAGFRAARGLPAGESVDADVWKALNSDTAMALVANTIGHDDVAGPFVTIPASMRLKAKLKHLGYSSALEGIAEKFHIAPALLQRLNPAANFNKAGQKVYAPNASTAINEKAARVTVSKSDSTVKALNADGKVIAQYPCTSGSEHDPLPIGEWQINSVLKNPKFNYNPDLFWDAKPTDAKATIAAGPNNPVGVVWIDLSKEHYGIHGSPSPGLIGHTESHGCIRLTNWDAMELAGMVDKGTPVTLTE